MNVGPTRYDIRVERSSQASGDDFRAVVDGVRIPEADTCIRVPLDGRPHTLLMTLCTDAPNARTNGRTSGHQASLKLSA